MGRIVEATSLPGRLIRDSTLMNKGVGVPFIREMTNDHEHIIVRVLVSE
jgi:hypothetical protein